MGRSGGTSTSVVLRRYEAGEGIVEEPVAAVVEVDWDGMIKS